MTKDGWVSEFLHLCRIYPEGLFCELTQESIEGDLEL